MLKISAENEACRPGLGLPSREADAFSANRGSGLSDAFGRKSISPPLTNECSNHNRCSSGSCPSRSLLRLSVCTRTCRPIASSPLCSTREIVVVPSTRSSTRLRACQLLDVCRASSTRWSSLSTRSSRLVTSLTSPPKDVFYPNQRGADLLHLHLEHNTLFHYRHFEPPHDTVVPTVS